MIVIPAIDIRKGKVVRLYRGLYNKETIYDTDPVSVAKKWAKNGAEILHIVDLDGAFYGELKNISVIKNILRSVKTKIHLGGGIRTLEQIKLVLDLGVDRVVMSTKLFEEDDDFFKNMDKDLLKKIIASIDSKAHVVLERGWTKQTSLNVEAAFKKIERLGIKSAVVTDISCDGTLSGPNEELLKEMLSRSKMNIICAGGISSSDDLISLKKIAVAYPNLFGVIIGKALYENKINLEEAITICEK
ncbi:MAG: 1-(5-phosphoribosyl)-5-[(5-phosphoribosylamino)methylideneamino]imidazole-4-carboxamide isomerase [Candidatus Omnitrophica bacterium]|nr:1-(5-phosphoribosyl)-5-[(5-phosphoribosylamino)methylideneamino]imidazole-4-carboxamide isomerase [Candidatus Omnitrophota bacterium]